MQDSEFSPQHCCKIKQGIKIKEEEEEEDEGG
jgi:hypothetical protein